MNFLRILAAASGSVDELVKTAYDKFMEVVEIVFPVLVSVVLLFGIIYGIVLGINFAKAEDTDGRDRAKQRLINLVIGVLVAVVIALVIFAVLKAGWVENFINNNFHGV